MTNDSANGRTGGRILVDALRIHGADTIFSVAGESYLALLDALYDVQNDVRLITCRKETGASNMAEAYGKLTGKPGICVVTRGPGACHASIGVHTAFQDSTPMILLIGDVPRHETERESFQEVDYGFMYAPLAKWVVRIDQPRRIPELIARAFRTATSGRAGPVVVVLPEDMLSEICEVPDTRPYEATHAHPGDGDMAKLRALLGAAARPVMIVGGSGWSEEACRGIVEFAGANALPVCCSFRRQHIFDNDHPSYAGTLGFSATPALVQRIREADLILTVGARLGSMTTQSYGLISAPTPAQTLIHVHADANEIGRVYQPALGIQSGMAEFAGRAAALEPISAPPWRDWREAARRDFLRSLEPEAYDGKLDLGRIMVALRERLPDDAIITTEAGNFSGWTHRFLTFRRLNSQLGPTSGAMAYGVPAAIAAKFVHPDRVVVGCSGDGGFLMSENEIATAMHYGLDPIFLVFNNRTYGTIRLHQQRHYPGRTIGTDLTNPDFAALAKAYGAFGETVTETAEFAPAFERALAARTAAVIELRMDPV
ncbi:MAG: thiamine pyrophosphate-binding protein [Proteobacteria bacterium]|nr:thiamine pyrophosphate-binding protein [Pseudomonadota bacterium]